MSSTPPATSDPPLARLLETPEPLSPDDEATVASARLRTSGLGALPVVSAGRLVGFMTEAAALRGLVPSARPPGSRCRDLVQPATAVPISTPVEEAVWLLQREEVDLLAVVSLEGEYLGVLSRRRMVEAVEDALRPRVVGGMATPLGVHLTSAHHRGGAGDLALMLTGLSLFLLLGVARLVAAATLALVQADPLQAALTGSGGILSQLGAVPPPGWWAAALQALVFFTLMRLTPLAGYHSGEHQTVHALERGLPLTVDNVALMPRAHLRCGTNLVVLISGVLLLFDAAQGGRPNEALVVVALVLLVLWRRIGMWLQQVFTTRPPTRRQIESGIQAGKTLLSRHQRSPNHRARWLARVWNRGLLQVILGALLGSALVRLAAALLGLVVVHV